MTKTVIVAKLNSEFNTMYQSKGSVFKRNSNQTDLFSVMAYFLYSHI